MAGRKLPRERSSLVRPWRQSRSAATVNRIAKATMRLLATKDFASISVDEIVRLAKTSKGAFYFRFASKAHLLRYLAEETFTDLSRESCGFFLAEETRKLTLAAFLDAFIDCVAAIYAERRNLLRAFLAEAHPGGDAVVVALVRAGSAESARMLLEALGERRDEIRHPNPAVAIPATAIVLGVTLRHTVLFPEQVSALPGITGEQMRAELRTMLWSYLHPQKQSTRAGRLPASFKR